MGKTRLQSRRRQDQGSKWARNAIAVLSTIGIIDTGSITFQRFGWLGPLSCPGGGDGCDTVLNSPWGTLLQGDNFNIPLSLLGLISYLVILTLALIPSLPSLSANKANLSRRTWAGLFAVSCSMAIFSIVLIGLMILRIKAFCFFCIISGIISLLLLVLTIIGGVWDDPGQLIFRGILLSLGILLGSLIWASAIDPSQSKNGMIQQGQSPIIRTESNSEKIKLAKHLNENNFILYTAYWCPHCHDQKELFGKEAIKELTVIECAEDGQDNQHSLCISKGITGYPSWEFNGEIISGVKSLEELAKLSQFIGE